VSAEPLLRQALDIYQGAGAADQVATTAGLLGDVLVELGRSDEALSVYRDGLDAVEDLAI
jgi:hypothetical protein